jgi:hypothetical protein
MLIPATPEDLKQMITLTDKLALALEPYVGIIQVTHDRQRKPNNGTGVVVSAPNAPGGTVVLSAKHVAQHPSINYAHRILLPIGTRDCNGVFLAKFCRIRPYSHHSSLDLSSFVFMDDLPTHKWTGIQKPPEGNKSGHALAFGFATRDAQWESNEDTFDVSLGTTAFLLKTISHGGEIAQLQLDIPHKHADYPGISGAPVWQFSISPEGVTPKLAGLIKGMSSGQTDITMHSVHHLKSDGTWLFST